MEKTMSKSKRQQGTAWWWAAIVIVLITLIGPVAEVLEAQQFPVPATKQVPVAESQQFSGATGTVQPDQRFANGGVIGAEGVVSNESGRKMLQALGAILVISGIGIGGYFLVRKYAPGAIPGTDARMKVMMRMPVGNKQSIFIVRVGERVLVVGATSGGMQCLSEITDPQEVQDLSYGVAFSREIKRVQDQDQDETPASDRTVDEFSDENSDVRNEIEWLRDRLEGYGERVEGEVKS